MKAAERCILLLVALCQAGADVSVHTGHDTRIMVGLGKGLLDAPDVLDAGPKKVVFGPDYGEEEFGEGIPKGEENEEEYGVKEKNEYDEFLNASMAEIKESEFGTKVSPNVLPPDKMDEYYGEPELPPDQGKMMEDTTKYDLNAAIDEVYKHQNFKSDPKGSGYPVCAIIDTRPKRFRSLYRFVKYLVERGLHRRIFHVQKGDCAFGIIELGHNFNWGDRRSCGSCERDQYCQQEICVLDSNERSAYTFRSVCEAMHYLHNKKDLITIHVGLKSCRDLINPDAYLNTEWFDVDEPCYKGDLECASQSLQYVMNYPKTAPFRMCSQHKRHSKFNVQTTAGQDVPDSQNLQVHSLGGGVQCLNKDQDDKPGPPNYWFHRKIKCMDYKIQFGCKCLYGCLYMDRYAQGHSTVAGRGNVIPVKVPKVKTLYDECEWKPFISSTVPYANTWDAELRAQMRGRKKLFAQHVCGQGLFDAMYIDARRIKDNKPWDETGELITKNTPTYGFLCINKNNNHIDKHCSDYKVRFCCAKEKRSVWGDWSPWTRCSTLCGGGSKYRTRACIDQGGTSTCFGNWGKMAEKFTMQSADCNLVSCPESFKMLCWSEWEVCARTCGKDRTRRRRTCEPALNGGKDCPPIRGNVDLYFDEKECDLPKCVVATWENWGPWTKCSISCGLGSRTKKRSCADLANNFEKIPLDHCLEYGGGAEVIGECAQKDNCPIAGRFSEWQNWSTCSVLCGDGGRMKRRRYCSNPFPQYGGKECEGEAVLQQHCKAPPCPVDCQWSNWGEWTECSVSCGKPGVGIKTRRRHVKVEAQNGGRNCKKQDSNENIVCKHKRMKGYSKGYDINFCPRNCEWRPWCSWSPPCPICYGDETGWDRPVEGWLQRRTRSIGKKETYGGDKCLGLNGQPARTPTEENVRKHCQDTPDCDPRGGIPYWSQWEEWGSCKGQCGKRGSQKRGRRCASVDGPEPSQDDCAERGGKSHEERDCPDHCPPLGWGTWSPWSSCPVTCGKAVQLRNRKCKDDYKLETLGQETCKGSEREQRSCDMGGCHI